ncbi:MAG: hypothetical protein RLZZ115_2061, partial [Cyanobacteriota bacterium]
AIAADLALGWNNTQLLQAIEAVADRMKSNY